MPDDVAGSRVRAVRSVRGRCWLVRTESVTCPGFVLVHVRGRPIVGGVRFTDTTDNTDTLTLSEFGSKVGPNFCENSPQKAAAESGLSTGRFVRPFSGKIFANFWPKKA